MEDSEALADVKSHCLEVAWTPAAQWDELEINLHYIKPLKFWGCLSNPFTYPNEYDQAWNKKVTSLCDKILKIIN